MAWSFVNSATATGANPSVTITGLPLSGDLLVSVVEGAGGATITGNPAGFTQQFDYATAAPRFRVCTKISDGTETTVAYTTAGGGNIGAAVAIYRNVISATPDVVGTVNTGTGVTSVATTSITTTVDNDLVISIYAENTSNAMTADAATTQRVALAGGSSYLLIADEKKSVAGATTGRTATWTGATDAAAVALGFKQANIASGFLVMFN